MQLVVFIKKLMRVTMICYYCCQEHVCCWWYRYEGEFRCREGS